MPLPPPPARQPAAQRLRPVPASSWQVFKDVEIDTEQPPAVFKMQLFSLTGVPPERQKIMGVKGGLLKVRRPGRLGAGGCADRAACGLPPRQHPHTAFCQAVLNVCCFLPSRMMLSGRSWGSSPAKSCP